jgi:hypothetical protein
VTAGKESFDKTGHRARDSVDLGRIGFGDHGHTKGFAG